VAVALIGGYALEASGTPQLDPRSVHNIEQAIRTVPSTDYPAPEVGLPRPSGSVRSYYAAARNVTTVIYTGHSTIASVRGELEAALGAGGWKPVTGPEATPRPISSATAVWTALLVKGKQLLQLNAFQNSGVTAIAYILQTSA
jgi:hypothetical protein